VFQLKDDSWVEGLVAVSTGPDPLDERLLSFSASGAVRTWELDAEQGCDVYRLLVRHRGQGLCDQRSRSACCSQRQLNKTWDSWLGL
jgi:hypothetical protein